MDLQGYILYLYEQEKSNERVGNVAERLLYSFVKRKICSTYQCYKDLKTAYEQEDKTITYKNVYKRVQKLYESNLIEKVNKKQHEETKHGAIFYKLTSFGIFYLVKNIPLNVIQILLNYKNNELFVLFLYPYIKPETIERLTDVSIFGYISHYLRKCCEEISDILLYDMRRLKETGGNFYIIGFTDTLADPENADDPFIGSKQFVQYIKENSDLKWLDEEKSKMVEVKRNKEIQIIQNDKKLSLKIDIEALKAGLFEDDREVFKFMVDKYGKESYSFGVFKPVTIQDYFSDGHYGLTRFANKIQKNLNELILEVIYYNLRTPYTKKEEHQKTSSKNALLEDQLFVNAINTFKGEIDYYYNEFFN
jgi:hypothetical protein